MFVLMFFVLFLFIILFIYLFEGDIVKLVVGVSGFFDFMVKELKVNDLIIKIYLENIDVIVKIKDVNFDVFFK